MAEKSGNPWRGLIALAVLIVLGIGTLVGANVRDGAGFVPKLALDLEGGTQIILTPKVTDGSDPSAIDENDIKEAINIIRQRIDASGVAEAEISTLGSNNIVVSIPGKPDEDTLNLVRTSATMRFRPVLVADSPKAISADMFAQSSPQSGAQSGDQSGAQSGSQSGDSNPFANMTPEEIAMSLADANGDGQLSEEPTTTPENNSDQAWITEKLYYDFLLLDCTDPASRVGNSSDDPTKPLAACSTEGDAKYMLGPADLEGTAIKAASAGMIYSSAGQATGRYGVNLEFNAEGTKEFAETSQRLFALKDSDPTRNRFAVVLDGNVISAPSMDAAILDGRAQITGNFTASSAQSLANQLNFGSLPLNFETQSEQQISATLGSNHLEKGILAGLIGLILVVLWMVWQYRGLALVSAGSLIMAAFLTYLAITVLSWSMGYRLSLAGVTGLIVAVGITADSFIVYFERIRDEVRDGVPLSSAVERGWRRARRTVVISDTVNLVAAVVLYLLAVGGVQGFAFTLGLTTIIDLVVIFLFTHPIMGLLMRLPFFGEGHRFSGLDPEHLGAKSSSVYSYVGRGRVRHNPVAEEKEQVEKASTGMSIAERRRAAAAAETEAVSADASVETVDALEETESAEGSDAK